MEFQENPYLIWQLIPALVTIWLGIYVQSRPRKKPESNVLSLLVFAGAFWSLANAIQLASPDHSWQLFWHRVAFGAIVTIPTAWFFLAVKFTGYFRKQVERLHLLYFVAPGLTILAILTNPYHKLFFPSSGIITLNGFSILASDSGPLFLFHTLYSYLLVTLGMLFLGFVLLKNFKKYGTQAYGLIIGVITPLVGNILYIFGPLPPGFPDPTPITFTITGIAFTWAIFAGRMLDIVPTAHETIVDHLSNGVMVLDLENKVMDINPAAIEILGLHPPDPCGRPLAELLNHDPQMRGTILHSLANPDRGSRDMFARLQVNGNSYEVRISGIWDKHGHDTGRMLQFMDISHQKQAEDNLATAKENLASILDTLKDYYFEVDVRGYVTNINKAFCEHLGFSRKEDVLGKHFRHFTNRESARQVFLNFGKVMETKRTVELFQYSYHTRDGRAHVGETTVSPIIEGNTVIGARGVLRDVTNRVKADEILHRTKDDLEARAQELAALNRIATLSNQSLNLHAILQALCVELTRIFPIRNAGIALITEDRKSLEVVAFHSADPTEESALGIMLPLEGNLSSQEVIEKKKTVVIQDSQTDPRMELLAKLSKSRGTKAIMIVPLLARGNAIGTIGMPALDPDHIFSEADIKLAEIIASQIAAAIDNAQLFAKTETALDVAERDLEIGRQIQSGFFPEAIPDIPGWEISAHFEAARQVAGDFYDFFQFENSKLVALVIADVCDKGVGAALFMVLFRSLLRAFSKTEINLQTAEGRLKNIMLNTNNYIAEIHGNSNMFATLLFGILDPESGKLFYVNGGHEPPVIMDKEGKTIQRLMPTGPAIGLFPNVRIEVEQVELDKGDFLVGFTDGVKDAQNNENQSFSEARFLKYLQVPWTSLFSMLFELDIELQNFMGGKKQFDDITLIAIRRKLNPDREQHAICRKADLSILGELRSFVESAAAQCGVNHNDASAFELAMEEACTNIIQHGYEGKEPGFLSLFFEAEANKARLIIRDDGKHFSSNEAGNPNKTFMDNVSYNKIEKGGNQLILEKNTQVQILERDIDYLRH